MREADMRWAIVPLKSPTQAKSRLTAVLSPQQRQRLYFELATRVILSLRAARGVDAVAVVTASSEAAGFARALGAVPIQQPVDKGMASAIRYAVQTLLPCKPEFLLTVAGDLPLVSATALDRVVAALPAGPAGVIVPDRRRRGTNVLLCRPPTVLPPCFGEDSFQLHIAAASDAGIDMPVLDLPELTLDLDCADDIEELRTRGGASANSLLKFLQAPEPLPPPSSAAIAYWPGHALAGVVDE